MKRSEVLALATVFLGAVAAVGANTAKCTVIAAETGYTSLDNQNCTDMLLKQIQKEIDASLKYLGCATYFLDSKVNYPGFAHVFLESSSEEREHAKKLIDYYVMRGGLFEDNVSFKLPEFHLDKLNCKGTEESLLYALELEQQVTEHIKQVIGACASDDNIVDYLSGDFLEEQYQGQKEFASRISTLRKLKNSHGKGIGEFIFDKKLIEGLF